MKQQTSTTYHEFFYIKQLRTRPRMFHTWITMCMYARNLRQALDAAKTAGHVDDSEVLEYRAGLLQVSLDVKGNHAGVS